MEEEMKERVSVVVLLVQLRPNHLLPKFPGTVKAAYCLNGGAEQVRDVLRKNTQQNY